MEQEKGKKNLCFVKTLVEIHLVSRSIVLTVSVQYIRESALACLTECAFVWYVCMYVSVCIGILSVTSQLLLPSFHWGRNVPLKILYCLPLVGYSNFSLF